MTNTKNKVQEAGNTCAQAANTAAEGVKSAASYVADQAKDMASNASQGAASVGSFLEEKAGEATSAVSGGLKAAGDAIRKNAPHDGRIGQASAAVAQSLSDTGEYLEREGLQGIANDLTSLVKRNPIPALLLGIGLGFLIARASSSSRT